jgi:hypothetical protein
MGDMFFIVLMPSKANSPLIVYPYDMLCLAVSEKAFSADCRVSPLNLQGDQHRNNVKQKGMGFQRLFCGPEKQEIDECLSK